MTLDKSKTTFRSKRYRPFLDFPDIRFWDSALKLYNNHETGLVLIQNLAITRFKLILCCVFQPVSSCFSMAEKHSKIIKKAFSSCTWEAQVEQNRFTTYLKSCGTIFFPRVKKLSKGDETIIVVTSFSKFTGSNQLLGVNQHLGVTPKGWPTNYFFLLFLH